MESKFKIGELVKVVDIGRVCAGFGVAAQFGE